MYVEHGDRLNRLARWASAERALTLVPLQNPLVRLLSALIFYALLPVAMLLFAWKAAVFPAWGAGLLCVAMGVVVSHVMLPFSRLSWPSKALLSISAAVISAAIIAGVLMVGFGPLHRHFDLFRANLSGQWLVGENLRKTNLGSANLHDAILKFADLTRANLINANLSGANLLGANLSGADLGDANLSSAYLAVVNLSGASLGDANLSGANLHNANLSGANLSGANLRDASLSGANLMDANLTRATLTNADLTNADLSDTRNLTQTQLDQACGNANTKLPEGLTLKPCSTD
jgi:uncharacterized protein YjbI with pentapeptide repeats